MMRFRPLWLLLLWAVVLMAMLGIQDAHARHCAAQDAGVVAPGPSDERKPATPEPGGTQPEKKQPTVSEPGGTQPEKKQPTVSDPGRTRPGTGVAKPKAQGDREAGSVDDDALDIGAIEPGAGAVRESELYGDRLDGLQREVDELKDKVFRSKARLALLRETVLRGVMAGSRVILAHRNLMGSGFRLVKIVYLLDGAQIYARSDDTGALDSEDELLVYDGNLPPGPHTVTVELTYNGHGYGMFSYLNSYTFESRSSHGFVAPEDGHIKIVSSGFERGNITSEMKDRPSVDFREIPLDASGKPLPTTRRKRSK
jgi:hypothetical protein